MAWIGAIVQGVMGGIQMGVAKAELDALPDPQGFSTSSDLATATSMARRAAQQGMSPAERAAAEQAIGTAQSRTQRSMEQRGLGNLAAAVSQIRTTEAMNQLAAQNAQIKRQSLGQYSQLAGQMQQLQNRNTQSFNQMLYAQQQALGQAAQAGFENLAGMGASIAEAVEGEEDPVANQEITVNIDNQNPMPKGGEPEDSPEPQKPGPLDPPEENTALSQPSENLLDADQLSNTGLGSVGESQFNTMDSSMNLLGDELYGFTPESNIYTV